MLTIGLTGGIGSGKTTVAKLFAELGTPIIDADTIAHAITTSNPQVLAAITSHFGQTVVTHDGQLKRRQLRQIIFQNPLEKQWLEALLHPLIFQEIKLQISKLQFAYCLVVIPLLLETKVFTLVERVLVIDAPIELQIDRTTQRDRLEPEQIASIIQQQASREARLAIANEVLVNDGDLISLQAKVMSLHQYYQQLTQAQLG
jgi:dephospho-CoA kinase